MVLISANANGVRQDIERICSFQFPGVPQVTEVEGIKNYMYPTDSCSYLVQIRPVTKTGVINDSATLNAFYGGAIKGILRGFKASKISEKQIRINGLIGEELEYIRADRDRQPVSVCSRILMLRGHLVVYTFSSPYSRFAGFKYARDIFFSSIVIKGENVSGQSTILKDTAVLTSDKDSLPTPVFDSVTARLHLVPVHRELVKSNTIHFAISFVACILLLLGVLYIWVRIRKQTKSGN